MAYLVCVTNAYRTHDPSTFASDEERAYARATMHYLFDVTEDAAREHDRWAHHTCCDWLPSHPVAVDGEPAGCPLCGEPITWARWFISHQARPPTPLLLRSNPMPVVLVDPKDGRCRECRVGTLKIIDADDATMTVECQNPACRETYPVETDAFGDGYMTYYPAFMAKWFKRLDSCRHKITVFRADVLCTRGKRLESYGLRTTYAARSSGKAL